MKVVTFKIGEELLERLDSYARLTGASRSEIIRRAIVQYLAREEERLRRKPKIVRLTS